jgi:ADP-heptose:LPS heptosyltransferase
VREIPDLSRTLFLQFSKFGDSLVLTPFLEGVKRSGPERRVYVIASPQGAEVYRNNPFIDDLAITPLRPHLSRVDLLRYAKLARRHVKDWRITTVVCDTVNSGPWPAVLLRLLPARHKVISKAVKGQGLLCRGFICANGTTDVNKSHDLSVLDFNLLALRHLGCRADGLRVQIYPSTEERQRANAFVDGLALDPQRPLISFAPYSSKQSTAWPTPNVVEFVALSSLRYNVLAVGGPADEERWRHDVGFGHPFVFPTFGMNLREMSVVIQRTKALVAVNSGASHLFQGLEIPMLRINGQHEPTQLWGYQGQAGYHSIEHPVSCSPCFRETCIVPGHPCMSQITAPSVIRQLDAILAGVAGGVGSHAALLQAAGMLSVLQSAPRNDHS